MTTETAGESASDSRLSALLKEAKVCRIRLKTERQERPGLRNEASEAAQKAMRNVYLKLLFNYPFSSRTRCVEVNIWTETTHFKVHIYRTLLSQHDKQLKQLKQSEAASQTDRTGQQARQQMQQLTQKYLRISNTFLDYLVEEETFYRELVGRMARIYDVEDAKPRLRSLGIACDKVAPELRNDHWPSMGLLSEEGAEMSAQGRVPANKERLVEIIHKGLLCCGDLARYITMRKEDADSRHLRDTKRGSRGRQRGGAPGAAASTLDRSRLATVASDTKALGDYTTARRCYEQARDLLPSNGNPSNQLAVLQTYTGDILGAVYHYYRALCVVVPFDRARQNLEAVLRRAIEKWDAQGGVQAAIKPWEDVNKRREMLENDLVLLHAHFYLPSHGELPVSYTEHCHESLSSLLVEKALAADVIVQITVTAIGSLWIRRLWRGETLKEESASVAINTEDEILLHLVGLMRVLVEVGASETREAVDMAQRHPPSDPAGTNPSTSLSRNITAIFRRMLPALRIASKWLKTHVEYIERGKELHQFSQASSGQDNGSAAAMHKSQLREAVDKLWVQYVSFINVIRFAFPFDKLPKLGTVGQSGMTSLNFEEDQDMRGFVPMKKAMLIDAGSQGREKGGGAGAEENQLHPNEEHLIRIADLLIDAKVVAESDSSPISFDDDKNHFYLTSAGKSQADSSLAKSSIVGAPLADQSLSRSDESKWENGSDSTEDAVDLAMRAVDERRRALGTNKASGARQEAKGDDGQDGDDGDEDDEIILIPSAARRSVRRKPSDTVIASPSVSNTAARTKEAPTEEPLTAQHLLLQVMNGSRSPAPRSDSSRLPPSLSPQAGECG